MKSTSWRSGRLLLPTKAHWLAEFQRELTLFPNSQYDDQVDSFTQFLTWCDEPKVIWHIAGE